NRLWVWSAVAPEEGAKLTNCATFPDSASRSSEWSLRRFISVSRSRFRDNFRLRLPSSRVHQLRIAIKEDSLGCLGIKASNFHFRGQDICGAEPLIRSRRH